MDVIKKDGLRYLIVFYLLVICARGVDSLRGEEAIRRFFDYFQADPPKGIPILNAAEPLDLHYPILATPVTIIDGQLYGHSQLIIETSYVDFVHFQGELTCFAPSLRLTGQYEWYDWLSPTSGDVDMMATEVRLDLNFSMQMTDHDVLHLTDIQQNVQRDLLEINMTGLNWMQQTIVDSGAFHLFYQQMADEMLRQNKPFIFERFNSELDSFSSSLPLMFEPLDENVQYPFQLSGGSPEKRSLVLFFRKIFQYAGIDPFQPPDSQVSIIGIKVDLKDMKMEGTSNINDIKAFRLVYMDKTIYVHAKIMFPHIKTTFRTEINLFIMKEKSNHLVNLHGVVVDLKIVINPRLQYPVISSEFKFETEWFGSLKRYGKTGNFHVFKNKIEKVLQDQLIKILNKVMQPVIQKILADLDLQKSILTFVEDSSNQ